jgi:hypothetical protein
LTPERGVWIDLSGDKQLDVSATIERAGLGVDTLYLIQIKFNSDQISRENTASRERQ